MLQHTTTVRAKNVDAAISKGLAELNLKRSEAEINIISEGKRGFLGFGAQDAIVEVRRLEEISYADLTTQFEQMNEITDEPTVKKEVVDESESPTISPKSVTNHQEYGKKNLQSESMSTERSQTNTKQRQKDQALDLKEIKSKDEKKERTDNRSDNIDEVASEIVRYLENIIEEYGAKANIVYEVDGKQLFFDIETDKSGLVIGKHGKIINSLQILAQTLLLSLYQHHLNVILNVGDYRRRRANVLEQMAMNTAEEVLSTRQSVILESLPAYERKQIHAHLSNMDNIRTYSEGREPNRYLIVEYYE